MTSNEAFISWPYGRCLCVPTLGIYDG